MTQPVCRRFVVAGRVQGVYYRGATQDAARRLGLNGWVRNCSDGSVELVACGDARALVELEAWLWKGSSQARVESVSQELVAPQTFNGFDLRR